MSNIKPLAILVVLGIGGYITLSSVYTVSEVEQVIITQFGKPVGAPVTSAGLKLKLPFIQEVNPIDKRVLEWDGNPSDMPTKDKLYISVDLFARWRITDPLQYFLRLRDERSAQSRLDDILGSETRNAVAKHELIEVVRSSNREFTVSEEIGGESTVTSEATIEFGRGELAREVLLAAQTRTEDLGIEILDFQFKRLNYVEEVRLEVYSRMISERQRIAEQFRSEGAGESARINGERERELKEITSEAYRQAQEVKGQADAEAADIYAAAYNGDPDFYRFLKTMEVLRETLDSTTVLVLSTDDDFLRYLGRVR